MNQAYTTIRNENIQKSLYPQARPCTKKCEPEVLLITEGTGYYQERGKPVRIVHKGDVIKCAPGVEHWHGATPDLTFAYVAVTPTQRGKTIWLMAVTEEEYRSLR